jgi:hypothetical protein
MKKNESGLYEFEVDDITYETEKWGAEMSLSVLLKIAKITGKPIGLVLGSVIQGGGLSTEISGDMLSDAVEALVSNMDEEVCIGVIKQLSSGEKILCKSKPVKFDSHYQGRLGHLFKVVKASVGVQYGDFFAELLAIIGEQKQVITSKAPIRNHKAQ